MIQPKNAPAYMRPTARKTFPVSLLALCIMSVGMPALAQENSSGESAAVEEIFVTGMRQSLESAQDIKRNAATVVESITAKDLGSFPDKSVAEALQRIPGVTVNRFAASSDTAHFSAEPSGVLVRGLNQVRTEFNGRDSFSANSSRGLSWGDVSPELMTGVDTYKNQMAELIEGGIAGTVNMRTRVPFDQDGQMTALSISGNYGDLSEKATPEVSGLYSNRWDTAAGEFGFLVNVAYSEVQTRSEGNQLGRMNKLRNIYEDDDQIRYLPADITFRDNLYDRKRLGTSLALQWKDADEVLVATMQYNRSKYKNAWQERLVKAEVAHFSHEESVYFEITPDSDVRYPKPIAEESFLFAPSGMFLQGNMERDIGWWGSPGEAENLHLGGVNAAGQPFVTACYAWAGCTDPERMGMVAGTDGRSNNNENMTQDLGINLKWAISDNMRANFDVQYVDSTVTNYDNEVGFRSFANLGLDFTGKRPRMQLSESQNVNYSEGFLSNPNNYWLNHIMDHTEDSEGDQFSIRADLEYDLDVDWAESIKFGVRHANRDQTVRWGEYNWSAVAPDWVYWNTQTRAGFANLDRHGPDTEWNSGFTGYPQGYYENRSFSSDFHNLSNRDLIFPNIGLLSNQQWMSNNMSSTALGLQGGGNGGWDPICSGVGTRAGEIPGTCYTPAEIADVVEKTNALYVQLNFGGKDAQLFGIPYSGNLGVRYVETDLTSRGGISLPQTLGADAFECRPTERPSGVPDDQPYVPNTLGCYINPDDLAFNNGAAPLTNTKSKHDNWLPSFNLKLEPTDQVVLRYAWSSAIARPDMGNLRNYVSVSSSTPSMNDMGDPLWVKNSNGDIVGANVRYTGSAHNPNLRPIEAKQHDLSVEYYWNKVSSVSAALFQKKFDNYIQNGSFYRDFTNNGITRTAEINGPLNGSGAKLQGFELAFQTFFDTLPAPFDGFGMQANYTYIDNKGIGNSNTSSTNVGGGSILGGASPDAISVDVLEGLSKNSYNVIGMYEKGDLALRIAYSWRSEYLVTAKDCCAVYPIWNDAQGHLDASIRYSINDNIELSLQGSNLTNVTTKLKQQVTDSADGGLLLPNAWFQNDRRYTLGVRFKY